MAPPVESPHEAIVSVLRGALRRWSEDDCGQRAAAIAYYSLLSFFPFILLLAGTASYFIGDDAADIHATLSPLRPFLPALHAGFWERVQELVDKRGVLSLFSLLVLMFLATRVTVAVQRAFRPIFRPSEHPPRARRRPILSRWFLAQGMTWAALVAIGTLLTAIAVLELLLHEPGMPAWMQEGAASALVTRHALPLVVLSVLAYALFAVLPEVWLHWKWRLTGALFFALAHDVAVSAWARITGALAPRDLVYGSFVGAVSFAAWTWVAGSLLLLSATLVAELNSREPRSSAPRPSRGKRRSARR